MTKGLSEKNAKLLLEKHGENRIKSKQKNSVLKLFAGQFKDALILILLASTLVSLAMNEFTEAITISAIVVINALLGFIQEFKTEKTLEKLGNLASPRAKVIRDGNLKEIDAALIVPGDIVKLEAGDRVPADAEITAASALSVDESMLSGESVGVDKKAGDIIYMGTCVNRGSATVRVTNTGADTEMGKIAGMIDGIVVSPTPLQKRLSQLSKYIGIGALLICAIVAVTGILRGEDAFDMFLTGISLAVAAVPEGLPAIVTIALALSINRMVKRRALTRKLHAVETLGCADVICSDKTGTLTENKMAVTTLAFLERTVAVEDINKYCDMQTELILNAAVLCNRASLSYKGKRAVAVGEPTECALLLLAEKMGILRKNLSYSITDELPFDSDRKMMSVLCEKNGSYRTYSKGAPDILLSKCTHYRSAQGVKELTHNMRQKILCQNDSMAKSALRVLAFAYREDTLEEKGLVYIGLMGLLDPPRKEVRDAVLKCKSAGIRPIMITGDHALTARAIAEKVGIFTDGDKCITGEELDATDDETLGLLLPQISVFARVVPHHKLRIVRTLKALGHTVAMTGDGVNDAPAIKEADIGVAMGKSGTDVTKEAADVILLDDNFATLVCAVEEGRVIYQNIRKFIRYLLSCNIGEVVTMFFSMLIGLPVPLVPIQILLINLVTDGLPAIALSLEPADKGVMKEAPRDGKSSVFSGGLSTTICVRGLLIGLSTLAVFYILYARSLDIALARTGALLTLTLTQLIHVFECKSESKSLFSVSFFNNKALLFSCFFSMIFMYFVVYTPFLSSIFETVPLGGYDLLTVGIFCLIVPILSGIFLQIRKRQS
ncbi:MAG: cation-translocating P-type ATPase [Clostridia bacterium]|nr:cation-translocating P-type ATPase [Clostridia bacterium]